MAKMFLRVCRECGHEWEVPKAIAKQGPSGLEMFGRQGHGGRVIGHTVLPRPDK